MQRQDSSQATAMLGNTRNFNIGSYDENTALIPKPRKSYIGSSDRDYYNCNSALWCNKVLAICETCKTRRKKHRVSLF